MAVYPGAIAARTKRNFFIGIITSGSIADTEIWTKVNKRFAILVYLFSLPLLLANIILFILRYPVSYVGTIVTKSLEMDVFRFFLIFNRGLRGSVSPLLFLCFKKRKP